MSERARERERLCVSTRGRWGTPPKTRLGITDFVEIYLRKTKSK